MGQRLLVADVGGTKTSFAVCDRASPLLPRDIQTYPSPDYARFEDVLSCYLQSLPQVPKAAVLALAGPIEKGTASTTNLPWTIDTSRLASDFGFRYTRLLNDVESVALAIPHLDAESLRVIQQGEQAPGRAIAVVAPGTGLGEAFLLPDRGRARAYPTEGGHATFAPIGKLQQRLVSFLAETFAHVSVERVCSGSGLPNIYQFLVAAEGLEKAPPVEALLAQHLDATPEIVSAALAKRDKTCMRAVDILVDILAAEAGDFALKTLATGGVYLAGGMPARLLELLQTQRFRDQFNFKGRFSDWLRRVGVRVVTYPAATLLGAAAYGNEALHET